MDQPIRATPVIHSTGNAVQDWFFANLVNDNGGPLDVPTDQANNNTGDDTDYSRPRRLMHLLFLHQNFPGQFGPLLGRLQKDTGWTLSFLHRSGDETIPNVQQIQYATSGGATKQTHYYTRTIENIAHQSSAALEAMIARPDIKPDLIVAHTGFVSPVPLQEHFGCPVVSYLEYFYHPVGADMDFRPEQQPDAEERSRARFRNASMLLDLDSCTAGLSPTCWQRDRFPERYRNKIEVIFDGIDTDIWHRQPNTSPRRVGRVVVPDGLEIVTYAARGFEAMRGFDIFMKLAKRLYQRRPNVRFLIAGSERICYGADINRTGGKSFKQWVLEQDEYDLGKFVFLNPMPATHLAELFSLSDLHCYFTVPFVLSWSLLNAMACGCTLLASRTPPVEDVIQQGRHAVLCDFFDLDDMVTQAERILDDPAAHRVLGEQAAGLIAERYALDVTAPRHRAFFERVANRSG